jgi:nuclear GTP-binding protein
MVAKKRASKRITLQKKYKIQKRTKEHHKKLKNGKLTISFKKKKQVDHIPNAWPYKDQLLKDIQVAKDRMEEVRLRKLEKRATEKSDTLK